MPRVMLVMVAGLLVIMVVVVVVVAGDCVISGSGRWWRW